LLENTMNRKFIAGVAFAATLAAAGLAQAQPNFDNYEQGGKPSGQQQAPSAFTSPGMNSPQYYYAPPVYGPAYVLPPGYVPAEPE
jgi:hypothetical protein